MKKRATLTAITAAAIIVVIVFVLSQLGLLPKKGDQMRDERVSSISTTASPTPEISTRGRELLKDFSAAFEEVAAKTTPYVVPIFSEQVKTVKNPFGMPESPFGNFFGKDFWKQFFGPQEMKQTIRALGSGVIVAKDGYILTNNHVVAGATKLWVTMPNHERYQAKVIGTDPPTDVAVIKIDANNLPAAVLGNSDSVKVGQWVIAIGNPFQLMHTVTAGIISAEGRSNIGLADYEDFIQTDASINPGNSGGALANLDGEVIGINTAIESTSGGNMGIGFAIPINMAKKVMDDILKHGKVVRAYVGLYLQDISEDLAKAMNLKSTNGALVSDVIAGGPAEKAGIKRGEVIIALNGKEVDNSTDLRNEIALLTPSSTVKLTVLEEGYEKNITVTLGERPKELASAENNQSNESGGEQEKQQQEQSVQKLGLTVEELTPDVARQLGVKSANAKGIVVTDVTGGSPADDAGIQRGDIIEQVNQKEISSVAEFGREIGALRSGDTAALLVRRKGVTIYLGIKIP